MLKKAIALCGLLLVSAFAQAQIVELSGSISGGTGALIGLAPPGTPFSGDLDWDGIDSELDSGVVVLGAFCFATDATGLVGSITSAACSVVAPTAAIVPILPTGESVYPNMSAVTTFQQAGTTFDGISGALNLLAFSPTFGVNIGIVLNFDGFGGGFVNADAGILGTANGAFTVDNFPAPPGPSGPAQVPTMSAYSLALMGLGLVIIAFRRFRR